jgi:hypothetical protein
MVEKCKFIFLVWKKAMELNTYFKVGIITKSFIFMFTEKNMFKTKIHNLTILNEMERTDTLIKLNSCIFI